MLRACVGGEGSRALSPTMSLHAHTAACAYPQLTPSLLLYLFHCRYADGDDKEALSKATVKLSAEEEAARAADIAAGKSVVDYLNSRWVLRALRVLRKLV